MYADGFISSLDRIAVWITRMVVLNALWILYTLAGLVAGGFFPATVAALSVVRKWVMQEQDINIRETFHQVFKREFLSANALGWILAGIGAGLYLNFLWIGTMQGQVHVIIPFAFYLILFFYSVILVWAFPLKAHYDAGVFRTLINALILGVTKVFHSIIIITSLFAAVFLSLEIPAMILFFQFSLCALIWFWFGFRVLRRLDSNV